MSDPGFSSFKRIVIDESDLENQRIVLIKHMRKLGYKNAQIELDEALKRFVIKPKSKYFLDESVAAEIVSLLELYYEFKTGLVIMSDKSEELQFFGEYLYKDEELSFASGLTEETSRRERGVSVDEVSIQSAEGSIVSSNYSGGGVHEVSDEDFEKAGYPRRMSGVTETTE